MNRWEKSIVVGFFVVVFSTILLRLWNENKILSIKLDEVQFEANEYQRKLRDSQRPTPMPTSVSVFFQQNYRSAPTDEKQYKLRCETTAKEKLELEEMLGNEGSYQIKYACNNSELNQWLVLLSEKNSDAIYSDGVYEKLVLFSNIDGSVTEIYRSKPEYISCVKEFNWYSSGQLVFSCNRIASGGNGDFSDGGPKTQMYDFIDSRLYTVEHCNPSYKKTDMYESQATGQLACISLCDSNSDCRDNHFCDLSSNLCVRKCSSHLECVYPFNSLCQVYKLDPKNDDWREGDVILGCGVGEQHD